MKTEELVQYYRLLDVGCGTLETSERIRNELVSLRHDQIMLRKKSLIDRILIILLTVVGGTPVLYGLLPQEHPLFKKIWVGVFISLAISFIILGLLQWSKVQEEASLLQSLLDSTPKKVPEENPIFLEMQISSFITRRSLAQEIISTDPPGNMKIKFIRIKKFWDMRINKAEEQLEELYTKNEIDIKRYELIKSWLNREPYEVKG